MTEQGRKAKIKLLREMRTCKLYYNEHLSQIEDEIHFFLIVNGESTLHLGRILSQG